MTDAYLENRPLTPLNASDAVQQDASFAADRLDGMRFKLALYAHCTFVNISFKGSELHDCRFINCVFIGCYFRKTLIRGCKFDGCRFIDCDFPKTRVQSTEFYFPRFSGCFIRFDEMRPNLPSEPQLCALTAQELAREAYAAGATDDARKYRIKALRAHEKHLWAGFLANTSWYKERYDSLARVRSGFSWLASQLNRLLWGNGERGAVFCASVLFVTLVAFPLLLSLSDKGIRAPGDKLTVGDYLLLSVDNVTGRSGVSGVQLVSDGARITSAVEVVFGLIALGLFVTLVFRRLTRWK